MLGSFLPSVSNVFRTADTQCMLVHSILLIWNWILLVVPSAWVDHRRHKGSSYTIEVLLQERLAGVLLETVPLFDTVSMAEVIYSLEWGIVRLVLKTNLYLPRRIIVQKYSRWIGCLSWLRNKISVHKYWEISEEAYWVIPDPLWETKETKRTQCRMIPWSELNELESDKKL